MSANDLIQLETTVTATSGSTLTLASVEGLAVGDSIIVESQHGYNETGLDGDWAFTDLPTSNHYYLAVDHIGKSFIAVVSNISGNVVTVDRTVPSAAVGLPCYRDNSTAIKYAIDNLLTWPSRKRFATAALQPSFKMPMPIRCYLSDTQATIDFNHCEIFAPRGCGAVGIGIAKTGGGGVSNKHFKNLTIRGNARDAGYGIFAETGSYNQQTWAMSAFIFAGTGGGSPSTSRNIIVENFTLIDNWRSISCSICTDCFIVSCTSRFTDPLRRYIQWEYQADSSYRIAFIDCIIDSPYARPGFEPFKCQGVSFIRCGGKNCGFASNSSGATLFKDCYVEWTDENPDPSWSQFNPLINCNRTVEEQAGSQYPGTNGGVGIRNFTATYRVVPYPETNRIFQTVSVAPGVHGIATQADIRGLTLVVPRTNLTTPSDGYMVRSSEAETTARGFVGSLDTGSPYIRQNTITPEDP